MDGLHVDFCGNVNLVGGRIGFTASNGLGFFRCLKETFSKECHSYQLSVSHALKKSSLRIRSAQVLTDALPVLVRKAAEDLAKGVPVRLADVGPLTSIH
ncbi:hypothetical protein [Microvirga sp. P5_D2]